MVIDLIGKCIIQTGVVGGGWEGARAKPRARDFREDEFISRISRDAAEACNFVKAGFEFVCNTPDDLMRFRKRN